MAEDSMGANGAAIPPGDTAPMAKPAAAGCPPGYAPDSAAWFCWALEELGETKRGFSRWMKRLGDDRPPDNIYRHIQKMAKGEARVNGEMRVILNIRLRRARRAKAAGNWFPGPLPADED